MRAHHKVHMDADYLKTLNKENLAWYRKFLREYYEGNFQKDGSDIHQTPEQRRDCYERNRLCERDVFQMKAEKVLRLPKSVTKPVTAQPTQQPAIQLEGIPCLKKYHS